MVAFAHTVVSRLTQGACVALSGLIVFAIAADLAPIAVSIAVFIGCCAVFICAEAAMRQPTIRRLAVTCGAAVSTLWLAGGWFSGPMHDVALVVFEHHGRFGCATLDAHGRSAYWLRDQVFAWVIFAPIILVSGVRLHRGRSASG